MKPERLLCPKPEGLYCAPGDFYIDPVRPVARAVITHGHADHARAGHGVVLATPETLAIMSTRYGEDFAQRREPSPYGVTTSRDGVDIRLVPAGHVLGSAQAVVSHKGLTMVVSGVARTVPWPARAWSAWPWVITARSTGRTGSI